MKVRNIVRKAAVLGSAVTMIGATVMGAMAYNLADYPTKYIADGQFMGKIVVGEKAATSDVLGAVDIAASLQAGSVTKEEVKIPGKVGEVDLGKNAFKFETSNDMLEIREAMGNVFDSLTDAELPALAGGKITTDQGTTEYNQYLTFDDGSGSTLQAIGVNYAKDKNDEIADFLVIGKDRSFFKWQLDFTEGLKSELTGGKLVDLEDEVFNIFGTEYTIVNTMYETGSATADLRIDFMTGKVTDTLREGETKTYTIDGVDYEVQAVFISDPSNDDPSAKFSVNGELTDSLSDGDTDTVGNDIQIGVRDLLVNSRDGIVQFFLGADKVEFLDTNVASTTAGQGSVEIGGETIDDVELEIDATPSVAAGDTVTINSITYYLKANPTKGNVLYVPSGKGVRDFVDEPQALLSPTFDIKYEGLKTVPTNDISLTSSGDDVYEFTATNMQGNEYTWPVFGSRSGTLYYGDDEDNFVFYETGNGTASPAGNSLTTIRDGLQQMQATNRDKVFNIGQDDYFLLSDSTKAGDKQVSVVLQYDSISTNDEKIVFTDLAGGKYTETYTANESATGTSDLVLGYGDITVGGNTYWFWIRDNEAADYPVAFDLNGNSALAANDETTFTVKGGGVVDFFVDAGEVAGLAGQGGIANSIVNVTVNTDETLFDTTGRDEILKFKISNNADDELDVTTNADWWQEPHYLGNSSVTEAYRDLQLLSARSSDLSQTYSGYGAFVTVDDSNDVSTLTIKYPESEVGAQVFVVAGSVDKTTTSGGAVIKDVVNPIAVGLAVLDKDAEADWGKENLLIVGGPCANVVAAKFLDNPANCGEGFEAGKAMIVAKEVSGKVAILVAGYEAKETLGASYVLADYKTYLKDVKGSEVEVVASDLSDLKVMTPE